MVAISGPDPSPTDRTKTNTPPPPHRSAHPALSQFHGPRSMSSAAKSDAPIHSPPAIAPPSSANDTDSPARHYLPSSTKPPDISSHPPHDDKANKRTAPETAPHLSPSQTPSH